SVHARTTKGSTKEKRLLDQGSTIPSTSLTLHPRAHVLHARERSNLHNTTFHTNCPHFNGRDAKLHTNSPTLHARDPTLLTSSPTLCARDPTLRTSSPTLHTRDPTLRATSPHQRSYSSHR
ncbi:hypothetical protein M9458_008929, partial [Cirrhinus mrigala]